MENITADLKCRIIVIKVASRCNLNCTYCYMYNLGDETYKSQPKFMSDLTVDALIERIKAHCIKHNIPKFSFIFHGGEPLLAGMDFFRKFVNKVNERLGDILTPVFELQTNAVLLTDEWCTLFGELNIPIGISLDGTKESNDLYRIDKTGKGSYDRIIKGLKIAQHSKALKTKPGLLSVINIHSDPIETYQHFKNLDAEAIDFLFPEATYDFPPTQPRHFESLSQETPYGDWLIKIFDAWYAEKEQKLMIRIFHYLIRSIIGGDYSADNFGIFNNEVLVIETDGGIEAVDVLKICGNGFTKAGANVIKDTFDSALQTDLARVYHLSHSYLAKECLACPVKEICGGGYIPHRYSKSKGFNNPSVYCNDLLKLITHIQNKILADLPLKLLESSSIAPMSFSEAKMLRLEKLNSIGYSEYEKDLESF
ncbi:radical SAM protein [Pedobacter cryoconitis]|uniref:Radical SAM core domain-containing protein n=1 Tax=Pedobacter cryoconitis TaxID=188932 RepID=A0A327SDR0_9SPHI|nr:radical SAM protein [Pedobacter cryoconitis]RAJ27219.1 uncharacterized protein LY11_03509 [Pedobacter cryoconitis]